MEDGEYHIRIEPRVTGGYIVSITGPRINIADVEVRDSIREAKDWAERRVAWHRTKEDALEYDL